MIKIIVAGSRSFNDYELLSSKLDFLIQNYKPTEVEIVSGTAKGADQLGETYANKNGMLIKIFPADWDKHGKSAGVIRNKQMAEYATHSVCFWDGVSRGTKSMIELSKEYSLNHKTILYEKRNR